MHRLAAAVLSALALAPAAAAQTFTWDGGASHGDFTFNDNWSTVNNWVSGPPTSSSATTVAFTASGRRTTATQDIASPFNLNELFFGSNSNVTTLSGNALSFPGSGFTI